MLSNTAQRKVLLVEDNVPDARLLAEYLSEVPGQPFELEQVVSIRDGLERLAKGGIDLILLDLSLPDSSGLASFHSIHASAPDLPIIVLSGQDDESLAIKTVHEGAQDYLVKGHVDPRLLVRSMRYAIERKRVEEALEYERDLFHTLLDNLPDKIYFKDRKSRFIRISREAAAKFKISEPSEAHGKTDFDFFLPEHAQAAYDDEQRILETNQPIIGKIEKETFPDGTVTWALTSKLPLLDKQNRVIGIFGISRDITTLKLIEDQLEAERNLLRNLINNLPDYIYVKDQNARFLLDNPAHHNFVGLKPSDDILGKSVFDFFPQPLAEQYAKDDESVIASGEPCMNREEMAVDRQNNRRWLSTTKVPLRNNQGQVIGLVGISRDITDKKLAEERLQQANIELARSKAEQEKVLEDLKKSHQDLKDAQFQLIQAEKMQTVGRLAAGVAHEVKNPLAILGMGIDYMTKNMVSPDKNVDMILQDMAEALKRADSIIMGLLDFSVPGALALQAENLTDLIEQTLSFVRHDMNNNAITLVRQMQENLPAVLLDRNKIKQVFVNVLTNAIHSMPEGGTLTIRTFTRKVEKDEIDTDLGSRQAEGFRLGQTLVVAEVLDTGHGIPGDKLTHIFDPFFTTKPTGKGTGLGLTVTRKIVELHGGDIAVRNRPGGGVAVTLKFKV
jgi:PAS domain S-box-containing protein